MQNITITHSGDSGQRIDRFVKKYFPNIALGGIYKTLRIGKIKVNNKKVDGNYRVELNDTISLYFSDEELSGLKEQESINETHGITDPTFVVLYEDDSLMVINKPAGLNVHAGDHKTTESNLIDQVQDLLKGKYDSLTFRPALVHRLDRDTSGCILVAKEKKTLELLLADLQSHKIKKIYHALVSGSPREKTGTIRAKLLREKNAKNEAKVQVSDLGQSAITHYKILDSLALTEEHASSHFPISLLECEIETGRTHQIRVHMAHIGCPILGDKLYGDKKNQTFVTRTFGIQRQMLHARLLEFIHPITKKRLHIEAPYPEDFENILKNR